MVSLKSNDVVFIENVGKDSNGEYIYEVYGVVLVQSEHVVYSNVNDAQKYKEMAKVALKKELKNLIESLDKQEEVAKDYLLTVEKALNSLKA